MAKALSSPMLELIRRVALDERVRQLSDHDLLERFDGQRDEAAFHMLLLRHGPMVLEVCRGVLGNEADAEDAFQATFLILVRKAASIRKTGSVGSWLHGVAYRTALKARAQLATRRKTEARAPARPMPEPDDLTWREVRQVVHEELTGLAERYRVPLVACYLEGKTQDEAAAQLGLAKTTLKERLERARSMLRARLVRRGLGPAAVLLATAWPSATAFAGLPATLVSSTIKAATLFAAGQAAATGVISAQVAALTEGVLKTMLLTKLKAVTAVVLALSLVVFGGGLLTRQAAATQQGQIEEFSREGKRGEADAPKPDASKPVGDGPQKPKADQDAIAWGKAAHGLQAGIRFRPGDKHSCRIGELAVFEVHLLNISDKTIQVSYLENVFEESLPTLRDGDGKEYAIRPGPLKLGDVPIVNRTLEAGDSVRLGFALFEIQPLDWKGEVTSPTLVTGPGKYLIGFMGFPLKREKSDRFESWSTGNVELEITAHDDLPNGKPVTAPLDLPNGKPVTVPLDLPKGDKTPPEASKEQWGLTTQGLQMSISATGKDKIGNPEFQVAIRNVGEQDVTLNLGMMLANGKPLKGGKSLFPTNIRLNLTDTEGKTRELHFSEPRIAGRVDDYVVPLRVGSVYTLKLPLSQFWSPNTKELTLELKPGKHQVSAQFEGGGAKHDSSKSIINFWEGKVQSNTLNLEGKPVTVPLDLPNGKPVTAPLDLPNGKPVTVPLDQDPELPAWANKLFEERTQELPKIIPGEKVTYRFTMRNIYKVPLDVTQVRVLNAEGATYSLSRKSFQPKDAGNVEVTLDSNRLAAGKDVKIYVTVGPDYTSTATLTIKIQKPK